MTNFAAIRILYIYRGIRSHFFPVSSVPKKDYSSSGHVKYIPGRSAQDKKTQNFTSWQDSAKKENNLVHVAPIPGNHASEFSNFDVNPSYIFEQIGGCSGIEESNESAQELLNIDYENKDELNAISKADGDAFRKTREEIEQVAVSLLAARAMTAIELQKKLQGKKYPFDLVKSVVVDFKSRGLLNDGMYAELFTRSRWISSTWGPRRIKHALLQKGVSETETERARKQVFEDDDDSESDEQNMRFGMCKLSMDRLFLQASKQWLRSQNTCIDNRRARIVRWLQYRGFNWGVTNYILKKLESQYPT